MTQAGNVGRRIVLAISTSLLALAPYATAQRTAHAVAPRPAIPHFNTPAGSFALGRATYASRFHRSFPYTSLPFPFFGDSFNPDDIYSTGYPVASQPPVILLQAARALAGPTEYASNEPTIPQPLVIELQNGRYVRLNTTPSNGEPLSLASTTPPEQTSAEPCSTVWGQPPRLSSRAQRGACVERTLPPALLVFRDGHSEEVRDYSIADGILYARGDYYTDGYWTKKIELSTLNVAQTLGANSKRNVKFVLPKSPNEVITRP